MTTYLLIDNGSVRPQSTLQLRRIAKALSVATGKVISPVSLQHADTIPAENLEGKKASLFRAFLQDQLQKGERRFIVIPLFFGLSGALSHFIPEVLEQLKKQYGEFEIQVKNVLYPLPEGEVLLVDILEDYIQKTALTHHIPIKNIVLVDHGSPLKKVTQVRQQLAIELQTRFAGSCIDQAAMERRAEKEYDFNGQLLEDWLVAKAEQGESSVIVALLFSLPGRHAGESGDIETICQSVMDRFPAFKIGISPLVGEHLLLIDILKKQI